MNFDINEAREIIEAAKKRGAIRVAGSEQAPAPRASEKQAAPAILPEWLRNEIDAPSAIAKPVVSPQWRSE
ncbi:MAG: hypothetical protein ABSE62_00895 [Chthoniobacteraceae bacterium]|jgi:hypothetical protein